MHTVRHPSARVAPPLALLAALALPAGAQPAARGAGPAPAAAIASAPVRDLRYEVVFDRASARRRLVRVTTTFATDGGAAPVVLSLPTWTPGAYELTPFARWVRDFRASAGERPLAWDKLDADTWRIRADGAREVTVRFDYLADTLDTAMSWARPDFLLLNGTTVFLYPEGRPLDFHAHVTVRTEADWKVATGMTPSREGPRTYTAPSYHDLVDMPFLVGRFDLDSAQVVGKWTRLATYPAGSLAGRARAGVWDHLRRMIPPQVAVFGEVPWDTYTVMQIADSSYEGASGLEHQNSHVDIVTPLAVGSPFLSSLFAHEIFHAWSVKRLRPADLWPYRYDAPQPTEWLWVSEGITDYYADLALVRGGLVDAGGFYAATAAKIGEVHEAPPVALEDASLSTWAHPADGTGYLYYPKGSLAGFMLDLLIRDASDGRASLDDVMRDLWRRTWKQGRGFTREDWWGAVARAAVRPTGLAGVATWADVDARFIDGREPFPWDRLLPLAGLRGVVERAPRLGILSVQDSAGVRVTDVEAGGAGEAGGLQVGDYVLSVGDIVVGDVSFGARFSNRYRTAADGTRLPVRVRRGAETLTVQVPLQFTQLGMRITEDPNAGTKALRIRAGLLAGMPRPGG